MSSAYGYKQTLALMLFDDPTRTLGIQYFPMLPIYISNLKQQVTCLGHAETTLLTWFLLADSVQGVLV